MARLLLLVAIAQVCVAMAMLPIHPSVAPELHVHARAAMASQAMDLTTVDGAETFSADCPDTACLAAGGDCSVASGSYIEQICPATQTQNGTTLKCTCISPTASFLALGTACTADAQCGATFNGYSGQFSAKCALHPTVATAITQKRCFSAKVIGDTCASDFDCSPPRVCTSGVCASNIASGATCLNTTTYTATGMCALGTYCWPTTATCDPFAALAATCSPSFVSLATYCGLGLICDLNTLKCVSYSVGTVAVGLLASQEFQCASGVRNRTSNICLDYDTSLAKIQSVIGTTCTRSSDTACNGIPTACQCGTAATGNTAKCAGPIVPIATMQGVQRLQITALLAAFAGGCEGFVPGGVGLTDTSSCAVRKGYVATMLTGMCTYKSAYDSVVPLACQNILAGMTCSGAATGASLAPLALLAAVVVAFFSQA